MSSVAAAAVAPVEAEPKETRVTIIIVRGAEAVRVGAIAVAKTAMRAVRVAVR